MAGFTRRRRLFSRADFNRSGFTLIEVMIAVAIIAVLVAFALPAYNKYQFDAKESEGVQILLSAHKDEQRIKAETGEFTEYLEGAPVGVPNLLYRPGLSTKFNLITGYVSSGGGSGSGKFDLKNLGYPDVSPRVNSFGTILDVGSPPRWRLLIGVERDIKQDGSLHVLAINDQGQLFKMCDQWSKQLDNSAYVTTGMNLNVDCKFNSSGSGGGGGGSTTGGTGSDGGGTDGGL